jgi:hypothetical protein
VQTANEWQRLTEYYRDRVDEELIDLAHDFEGLTDVAQGILREELKRRGLPRPEDLAARPPEKPGTPMWRHPAANVEPPISADDEEGPHDYTWKVVLCECNEREDAMDVIEALESKAGTTGRRIRFLPYPSVRECWSRRTIWKLRRRFSNSLSRRRSATRTVHRFLTLKFQVVRNAAQRIRFSKASSRRTLGFVRTAARDGANSLNRPSSRTDHSIFSSAMAQPTL